LQKKKVQINNSMHETHKNKYTAIANQNAGIDAAQWLPNNGYLHNEEIMYKVYSYYQSLYLKAPNKFLWLGLARLTGGQVLWGMNRLVKIAKDPCAITVNIVAIAKEIFEELAWQHEMYLLEPDMLIEYLKTLENKKQFNPANIWESIHSTTNAAIIAEANRNQLHNEQLSTVQPHYEIIRQDSYSKKFLWLTRFTMRNIHPYHKRFIVEVPFKDVTVFAYRWQWISHAKGMWASWVATGEAERTRLVRLSNEAVIQHDWQ
jgi:hypothetical protein